MPIDSNSNKTRKGKTWSIFFAIQLPTDNSPLQQWRGFSLSADYLLQETSSSPSAKWAPTVAALPQVLTLLQLALPEVLPTIVRQC